MQATLCNCVTCIGARAVPHHAYFVCSYDGTVRNSVGDVIQFLYGEDGMDGAAIEGQTMEHLRWDRKKLEVARVFCMQLCMMACSVTLMLSGVLNCTRGCLQSLNQNIPYCGRNL